MRHDMQHSVDPLAGDTTDDGALTVGDLLSMCYRRKFILIPVGLLVTVIVFIMLMRQVPMYEAEASLAIDRGRKAVRFAESDDQGRIEFSLLNTYRDMLLSRPVIESALEHSGYKDAEPYSDSSDPVATLIGRVSATTSRDSWVIGLSVQDEDPQHAEALAAALMTRFIDYQSRQEIKRSEGALSFLSTQVMAARERVTAAQAKESAFREANSISSSDVEDNIFTETISRLIAVRLEVDRRINRQKTILGQGKERLLELAVVNDDAIVASARQRLLLLREEQVELGQRFLAKHPRILEVKAQITQATDELLRAAEVVWQGIEAEIRSLENEREILDQRIEDEETRLADYRRDLSQLAALEQETQSRKRLLEQLLTRMGEEEVTSRLESGRVTIINPARAGEHPVNIRRSLFAAAALMLGGMCGLAVVLLVEFRDRRIRGVGSVVGASRLPVLSRVPHAADLKELGQSGDPRYPIALADAIRVLRAKLGFQSGMAARVVLISSSRAGEGKSTITARLAVSAAAVGLKTLLVDADLRRPTQHKQFAIEAEHGLSEGLSTESEIVPTETAFGSLEVIVAGESEQTNPEALGGARLRQLIEQWRGAYDLVLIDTPPLGVVADALPLCDLADSILLVVRDRLVTKDALAAAQDRLQPFGERVAGIVMNGEKQSATTDYGYGYGSDSPKGS